MREVEEYAQPGDEDAARAVRRVARDAVAGFAARLGAPAASPAAGRPETELPETELPETRPPQTSAAGMFRDLGRLLAMEGRSLAALHAALRVGARVTWHRLQEQARAGSGNPEAFTRVGEAVFWYLDELTASCSAGYAEARAELAGETSELRRRLLDMLTSSPAPPAAAIAGLARAAGWPLPRRVAAVALAPLAVRPCGPVPPGMLADLTRRDPCLLVADPDGPGRRHQLATVLGGWLTTADPHWRPRAVSRAAGRRRAVSSAGRGGWLAALGGPGARPRRAGPHPGREGRRRGGGDCLVRGPAAHAAAACRRGPGGGAQQAGARAAARAAPRPGGPAGADAARLAGKRRRRQCRRAPAARPPADDPLPAAAGQRAVRRRAR